MTIEGFTFHKRELFARKCKSQALQLYFDNNQQFQFAGNHIFNASSKTFSKEDKDSIMKIAEPLRTKGLSFDNIRTELAKMDLPKVPP